MSNYNIKEEIWKDVSGYEGLYQVSNKGSVRSLDRVTVHSDGRVRKFFGKVLKPREAGAGYYMVQLAKNGVKKHAYVHRLVALEFANAVEGKEEVNHKDGNKHNNCIDNLEWVTPSENKRHAYSIGLRGKVDVGGAKNGRAKLTEDDVVNIRKMSKDGYTYSEIGEQYKIHKATVGKIVRRLLWKNV